MRLIADVVGAFNQDVLKETKLLRSALQSATKQATDGLKRELRGQITSAGMGRNLANSWQSEFYENKGVNPAGFIYSKAPYIIESFDEGVLIRGKTRRALAIPTKNAPKRVGSNKKITPKRYAEFVGPLRYIKRPGKNPLLVADVHAVPFVRGKKKGKLKQFSQSPTPNRPSFPASVVMFVLVPVAQMPRVLDVEGAVEQWSDEHVKLIERKYLRSPRKK